MNNKDTVYIDDILENIQNLESLPEGYTWVEEEGSWSKDEK